MSLPAVSSKEQCPSQLCLDVAGRQVMAVAAIPVAIPSYGPPTSSKATPTFVSSFWARLKSFWTQRLVLALLAGQLVSLCITCTNIVTLELVNRGWNNATTQSFFLYFALFLFYTPYTMYKYGIERWGKMLLHDGWKYFVLAACDVEGNFLMVKAYQYTTLLSCILLDAWTVPVCLFFVWLYMRPRSQWTQILGIILCMSGLGLLVASDKITERDTVAVNLVKGDIFVIIGATLYGFTNATEEFLVRKAPLYEVVGMLGLWGTIICGAQAAGLEHQVWMTSNWDGTVAGYIFAYTAAMFILYTVAPYIYRLVSSTYFNISILTSDFYGLLFGLTLFHYRPYWLYGLAFVIVITGLIIYLWPVTPEEQHKSEPQLPLHVEKPNPTEENEVPVFQ